MWRMGFDSPENFDDDQTYCGSVESQSEGFMLIPAVIITAEAGAFSGVQTADVVESVEILGTTFQDNMKHLLVKHTTTNNPPESLCNIFYFRKICYGNNCPELRARVLDTCHCRYHHKSRWILHIQALSQQ